VIYVSTRYSTVRCDFEASIMLQVWVPTRIIIVARALWEKHYFAVGFWWEIDLGFRRRV